MPHPPYCHSGTEGLPGVAESTVFISEGKPSPWGEGVRQYDEEEFVDPCFALSAFFTRRDKQFTSKLQTVSTVPSLTRHDGDGTPPLCRKSQKRSVFVVAARAGRCWNLSSHGGL